jgi:hypothetical protein
LKLPIAGNRYGASSYYSQGYYAYYWSSSPNGEDTAWVWYFDEDDLYQYSTSRYNAFPIRCFQNTTPSPLDTTPPIIVLSGDVEMTIVQGDLYVEAGADWTDDTDGTGTLSEASSGSVDTSIPGLYTLEY